MTCTRPAPGPLHWDWRCLRCGDPIAGHDSLPGPASLDETRSERTYMYLVVLLSVVAAVLALGLDLDPRPGSCPAVYPDADSAPSPLYGFGYDPDDGRWSTPTGHTFGWSEQEDTTIYACPVGAES